MAFVEDLSVFLDEFSAVPVVANGVSGYGIYDMPGDYVGEGDSRINDAHVLRCLASQFGSLLYQDSITVDGQSFKVRDNLPIDDGKWRLILLTKLDVITTVTRIVTLSGLQITTLSGDHLRIL